MLHYDMRWVADTKSMKTQDDSHQLLIAQAAVSDAPRFFSKKKRARKRDLHTKTTTSFLRGTN